MKYLAVAIRKKKNQYISGIKFLPEMEKTG